MSDTISRAAAIDAPVKMVSEGLEWIPVYHIKELPSAEPERLTDDDFETIRIHLNAYKEKLCNQQRWEEAEEYQRIIDRFMAFASAQPDLQPTCNNLATDTISRQVAIDMVKGWNLNQHIMNEEDALDDAKALPSAETEIIRCKDCKYRKVNEHYGEKGYINLKAICELDTGDIFQLGRYAEEDDWFCADAERREGDADE